MAASYLEPHCWMSRLLLLIDDDFRCLRWNSFSSCLCLLATIMAIRALRCFESQYRASKRLDGAQLLGFGRSGGRHSVTPLSCSPSVQAVDTEVLGGDLLCVPDTETIRLTDDLLDGGGPQRVTNLGLMRVSTTASGAPMETWRWRAGEGRRLGADNCRTTGVCCGLVLREESNEENPMELRGLRRTGTGGALNEGTDAHGTSP
mmetsp:Transcript_42389/g.111662  ORF Transcript_42389/g.111662 Transcript_42389/m.111662 type:complete len:204 (-) Transcript_42389:82-693(-)